MCLQPNLVQVRKHYSYGYCSELVKWIRYCTDLSCLSRRVRALCERICSSALQATHRPHRMWRHWRTSLCWHGWVLWHFVCLVHWFQKLSLLDSFRLFNGQTINNTFAMRRYVITRAVAAIVRSRGHWRTSRRLLLRMSVFGANKNMIY